MSALPYSLNNCYADIVIWILGTDNWGIGAPPGHDAPHDATGATISRINHRYVLMHMARSNCSPLTIQSIIRCASNTLFRWNEEMFAAEVRALRPIPRGEEVTMCYVPELERHSARQARLRDAYGFICICELCARDSNELRAQLQGLPAHGELLPDARRWAWARDRRHARDGDALLEMLERQAKMMEQEMYVRPEGWLAVARPLVKIHSALGNAVAACRWAVCAASYARAATGTDGGWRRWRGRLNGLCGGVRVSSVGGEI